jgi:hypothetical protein
MCNKGGSPPVPNQTSTAYQSATAPSAFAKPFYEQFVSGAQALSQTPFNPAMQGQVAPMNAQQVGAGNQLYNLGLGAGTFDPAQVRAIESPFTEDVVTATQNWFNNQNAIQGNDLLSQAIRTGNAFGGDRAGIAEAALAGQQQLAQAPVIAGLRQAGYTQALDEYNKLKQAGLTGAGAALGWGALQQQQQQRELDVAQQNAMMSSAYPFQLQNWYGATLGGIGPMLGSFAQGYTTPPQPNELTQGLGIASSLIGLGTSLFGKHGGPVERKTGGLVPIIVARRGGGPIPGMRVGGLVPIVVRRYGGPIPGHPARMRVGGMVMIPRRQYGGNISLGFGGDSDEDEDSRTGGKTTRSFSLDQLNIPSYKAAAPPDAGRWMEQRMRDTMRQRRKEDDNPTANAIDSLAGIATKLAPLALMALKSGGKVKHYANGNGVDDDDDDTTDTSASTDDDDETTGVSIPSTTAGVPLPPPRPPGAEEPTDLDLSGGYTVPPGVTPAARAPRDAYAQAGIPAYGRAGAPSTTVIPGLGPPPRSFAQRWATNPFTAAGAAMLASRSPYFGAGLGAGIAAGAGAVERGRKEELLDQKPQMLTDGDTIKYRVGNKIVDTGLRSPQAARQQAAEARQEAIETRQERLERTRQEGRLELERERAKRPSRTAAPAQEAVTQRAHIRNIEKNIQARIAAGADKMDAARDAIQEYNDRYGTTFKVPAGKPPPEQAAPGKPGAVQEFFSWLWKGATGASPSTAKPQSTDSQGWMQDPATGNWKDPEGRIFDRDGKRLQ